ncbi:MAG: histidine ammonia-lyase [Vicingaceae bacterium]
MQTFKITKKNISLLNLFSVIADSATIELSEESRLAVVNCRNFLEEQIAKSDRPIYGVNTGFGSLRNKEISRDEIAQLQENLVLSHACGVGAMIPQDIAKVILLLKILNLSLGKSGIRLQTLERLIFFYNNNIIPVIYEQGSLGASGDLAPLAHLSLPLLGEGEVWFEGQVLKSEKVLSKFDLKPIRLEAKEGLAMLNGTQFMSGYGLHMLYRLDHLLPSADVVTAMSIDAFSASLDPFSPEIQEARPHPGQLQTARRITELLEGSAICRELKSDVQDPYSFRCIPQVHGASLDAINYFKRVVETEISSVTDNPMVFPEEGKIISAGNFHGQPLALTLDFVAIGLAELTSISERRIYKLISGQRGLPEFLIEDAGLNSGFMIPQYTAASLVSQNKQLCSPASTDTIDSSNGQEDHVSMGANSALKCLRVLNNYSWVLGIELLCAAQGLDFRRPLKSSESVEQMHSDLRKLVPYIKVDAELHVFMRTARNFLDKNGLVL